MYAVLYCTAVRQNREKSFTKPRPSASALTTQNLQAMLSSKVSTGIKAQAKSAPKVRLLFA